MILNMLGAYVYDVWRSMAASVGDGLTNGSEGESEKL